MKLKILVSVSILLTAMMVHQAIAEPPAQTCRNFYGYVTVTDPTGSPVQGVLVKMHAYLSTAIDSESRDVYGTTNSSGQVTLYKRLCPNGNPITALHMTVSVDDEDYTVLSSSNTSTTLYTVLYPEFELILDKDGDAIDDNLELQLAEKFKPVLHKHSYDLQQNLENLDRLIQGGFLTLNVRNDNGQIINTQAISGGEDALHRWYYWNWDTYGWGSVSHGSSFLDITDSQRYVGAPVGQRPLYYHVYDDENHYYVQYWYFLGMNDVREQLPGIADNWHEGDWEHVSIRLTEQAGSFVPDKVNFYVHEGGVTVNASQCRWSSSNSTTYDGLHLGFIDNQYTHLHIWIAANSHASYNRGFTVYERNILGIDYHDRVDYYPSSYDLYFSYDTMIKLGEIVQLSITECPDNGYSYQYHVYPIKSSKHWLAYLGRIGDARSPIIGTILAPLMPANGGISHEWLDFTLGDLTFGNESATVSWIVDDSTGD